MAQNRSGAGESFERSTTRTNKILKSMVVDNSYIADAEMLMSAYIRSVFRLDKWTPILIYFHGSSIAHRRAIMKMANALLDVDIDNYDVQMAASCLSVQFGRKILFVPLFEEPYKNAVCVICPLRQSVILREKYELSS